MRYADIGSISSGTLRTEDLLAAFSGELVYHANRNADELDDDARAEFKRLVIEADAWCAVDENDRDEDAGSELFEELVDAIEQFSPPYCYFGTHEGDGADYGFWPCVEAIEELPRVENGDEAKALGEDAVHVNDHGNMTVYGGDGSVLIELV